MFLYMKSIRDFPGVPTFPYAHNFLWFSESMPDSERMKIPSKTETKETSLMIKSFTGSLYYRVPFKTVYWLSLIYFSLKSPLKSQTVNLKPNECLAVLKNNKRYHRQIRRVEKFMEDEMHVASSGWGNSNRTTTQTMWRARPWPSMSCCSQQGIEDVPSHGVSRSGLLRVTSQRTVKGRARPCCLPE